MLRIIFSFLMLCCTLVLLAQKRTSATLPASLITIKNLSVNEFGSPDLQYLELKCDDVTLNKKFKFPNHHATGYVLYSELKSSDGTVIYNGYKAPKGYLHIDTAAGLDVVFGKLFIIPAEYIAASPGQQTIQTDVYVYHHATNYKFLVASKTKTITIPEVSNVSLFIRSVKIPDSESYDARALFASHIPCNADLYVKVFRGGTQVHRSGSLDNTCVIGNVNCKAYSIGKTSWYVSAMDFDNTSFDDKVDNFNLGTIEGTEKEKTLKAVGGSEIVYSATKEKRPYINPYGYTLSSETAKREGVSGIAYKIKGKESDRVLSPDFAMHYTFAGISDFTKAELVQKWNDSILYFIPFCDFKYGSVSLKGALYAAFNNDLLAEYSSPVAHEAPVFIRDNEIKNLKISYEKIKGTMCFTISVSHSIPAAYLKDRSIYAHCELAGSGIKMDSVEIKEATSDLQFVIPVRRLADNKTSVPLKIETFTLIGKESLKERRYFNLFTDTVREIKADLENVSFRVTSKVGKKYKTTATWAVADDYSDLVFAEKPIENGISDFSIRKHAADDIKLKLNYDVKLQHGDGARIFEELMITSDMLKGKGKVIKLKSLNGAKKISIVRL